MRRLIFAAAILFATVAVAVSGHAEAGERPMQAQRISVASAQATGIQASYRGPVIGHGYTARARHAADCLATHPNYDPRTDRIRVAPGVSKRCTL